MRRSAVLLASLGLVTAAYADVSIGAAAAPPSRPEWVATCSAALEDARKELASTNPQLATARIRVDEQRGALASPDCQHDRHQELALETRIGMAAAVWTDHGAEKTQQWTQAERWWNRRETGRATGVVRVDAAHPIAIARLQKAVDACIAAAPQSESPPPATNDGEQAANELERACMLEGHLGVSVQSERTKARLARLMSLGPRALPLLLRLAHARNAAARAAAALGLAQLDGKPAQEALEQLTHDRSPVSVRSGCGARQTTVGEIAEELDLDR